MTAAPGTATTDSTERARPARDGGAIRRIAFLDSWARSPERGSGTAVAITGLADAVAAGPPGADRASWRIERIGVEAILSRHLAPGPLPTRLAYNLALPLRLDPSEFDAVVGFDFDGCLLGRGRRAARERDTLPLQVVALKGVAADERRFETGIARALFGVTAALEGRNARRADRVLVTSAYCRERAAEAYGVPPERFRIVPEGIDLEPWTRIQGRQGEAAPGRDRRPDSPGRGPTILNIARQYRRKDTRTLIVAMIEVENAFPGARLHIVGGGPELPALRRQARRLGLDQAVRFLGELPDDQVRRELLRADVFCLPSRQEGFGIVLLEAMAAGTPIVSTTAGAIPEVAPDGEVALLVRPGDPGALGAALVDLLGDPERRERMAAAGRRRVRRYAWPRVAGEFLEALGLLDPD